MTSTPPPQAPYKQLRRPVTDRMVAGVASGLGRYFAVDPTLVRVVVRRRDRAHRRARRCSRTRSCGS